MQAADPPLRGSYLEIRRGAQVIVARVMWTKSHRFGIKSQDLLSIDAIVSNADVVTAPNAAPGVDRRIAERPRLTAHEQSRWRGRVMEYGFATALAAVVAVVAANEIYMLLSAPIDSVTAALSGSTNAP